MEFVKLYEEFIVERYGLRRQSSTYKDNAKTEYGKSIIKFVDAYPTSLSSIPFDITTTDVEYLTAVASFRYSYYQFL